MKRHLAARAIVLSALAFVLAACGGGGGGGGGTHALGEEAVVAHSELTDTGETAATTTLGITVLAVRQGSHAELEEHGFEADPEDQDTTPYYVDVRYENQGDAAVEKPLNVSLEDTDGNLIGSTLIFNYGDQPFPPCEADDKGKLQPGDSFESCTLVLVPPGVEIATVSFLSNPGGGEEPEFVYWEVA